MTGSPSLQDEAQLQEEKEIIRLSKSITLRLLTALNRSLLQ